MRRYFSAQVAGTCAAAVGNREKRNERQNRFSPRKQELLLDADHCGVPQRGLFNPRMQMQCSEITPPVDDVNTLSGEETARLLVNAVTDYAIFMLDSTGKVASWNAGAERFKGYASHEIIGRHFSAFYTPEDQATGLPARALRTAASEGKFEAEGWRVRKDGTRFWAHVVIDPVRNHTGDLIGYAKITRDLTERRLAQQKLEETREALFQSQKMEAIGKLTGGVAHDFNNLLTVVIGSLELVQKRLHDDPLSAKLLKNAVQAAQRGATLTQRMLAFARRQELKPEVVDIPLLVRGMTDLLNHSVGADVTVVTSFPAATRPVMVDPNQLEMAILNLAVNARDAMPNGGSVTIAADEETLGRDNRLGLKGGSYVRLSVADDGAGMDSTTLGRALEPFFTTKGVGKGTGLGLSMVHGVVEQSGGRLFLESRVGEGTSVSLFFPVREHAAEAGVHPPRAGDPLGFGPRPLSILVVDDDALVLLNTAAMLEDVGHRVVPAHSGREAMDILSKGGRFDLLLTDQLMPNMTGAELIEAVRSTAPTLPVALMTGYAEIPLGLGRGVPRLTKPFFQAQLLAFVTVTAAK
jgi:PAS domain S-box-containing protein